MIIYKTAILFKQESYFLFDIEETFYTNINNCTIIISKKRNRIINNRKIKIKRIESKILGYNQSSLEIFDNESYKFEFILNHKEW